MAVAPSLVAIEVSPPKPADLLSSTLDTIVPLTVIFALGDVVTGIGDVDIYALPHPLIRLDIAGVRSCNTTIRLISESHGTPPSN